MTPELERLIVAARERGPLTPREVWQQHVSFAYGSLPEGSTTTREEIERRAVETYGPCPEDGRGNIVHMRQVVPTPLLGLLYGFAATIMASRAPDLEIGPSGAPYFRRWMMQPKNERGNLYVHKFLGDDDARAEHDHPFDNVTVVLDGGYREVSRGVVSEPRLPGDVVCRNAREPHRVVLLGGPSVSLFFHGERYNEPWGFHCPNGWRSWHEFLGRDPSKDSSGGAQDTGRGCA